MVSNSKKLKLPCFVYDVKQVEEQLQKLKSSFENANRNTKIFYSYKTNSALASYLVEKGLGLQVTSLDHLLKALKLTSGKNIIFSSRELSKEIINLLIKNKVKLIINSESQLQLLNSVNKNYPVGLRIDTGIKSEKTSFSASDLGLGIPYKEIDKTISPNVEGFHNHLASQITDLKSYKENSQILINLSKKFKVKYLDIGGGFPTNYLGIKSPEINDFSSCYKNLGGKLYLEPGRFLVGSCGKLITKILEDNGKVVVINASLFNTIRDRILSNYKIKLPILEKGNSARKIVGNSPSSSDYFGEYKINQTSKIITFLQAGAYCISDDKFTGVEKPKEYIFINDKFKEVK